VDEHRGRGEERLAFGRDAEEEDRVAVFQEQ
jgi:hypothetical protein